MELFKGLQTKNTILSIRIKRFFPAVAMDCGDMETVAPVEAAMKLSAASMEFWTQKKPEVDIADDPMPEFDVGNLEGKDTYTMSFMSQESKMEPRSSYYTFGRAGRSAPIKPGYGMVLQMFYGVFYSTCQNQVGCYSVLDGSTHNQRSVYS